VAAIPDLGAQFGVAHTCSCRDDPRSESIDSASDHHFE